MTANVALTARELEAAAPLTPEAIDLLEAEMTAGRLSARGAQRVRCVARTLVDLGDGAQRVDAADILAALAFRATPSFRSHAVI